MRADEGANRLVVVDDEPAIGRFVERVAGRAGYQALSTSAPDDFRKAVRDLRPTHVMLDLNMPEADGIELLRFLAEDGLNARILICSGVEPRLLEQARRLGVERGLDIAATIGKPVRAAELKRILEEVRIDPWLTPARLAAALRAGEIVAYFQPQLDARTGALWGFEALARWLDPTQGMVPPTVFVPFAEQHGMIGELTSVVAERVVERLVEWDRLGLSFSASINLSARDLGDVEAVNGIMRHCARAGIDSSRVTFELTETAAMDRLVDAMEILTRLRLRGFSLAIDDFGTGYSSLVQLQRLPFTELKIDRAFVANCLDAADSDAIIRAVVALAREMEMSTVAEGVENAATADRLRQVGCDRLQGFLYGKPMPPAEVTTWLANRGAASGALASVQGK